MARAGTVVVDVEAGTSRFESDIAASASRAAGALTSGIGRAGAQVFSDLTNTASAAAKAVGTITIAAAGLGIKTAAELETANLQFETLLGSAEAAEERVASLFEFAKATPFETQPIIEASRLLQTFGGDALAAESNLTLIGDAAAASSQQIDEIAFWVGRAYAAIQGGQPFGEAAARLQEMALLTPQARAEMERLQEEGASASEVFGVLEGELGRFDGAMVKMSSTFSGLTSTLSDVASLTSAGIFEPLFLETKDTLAALVEFAETPAFAQIEERASQLVAGFLDVVDPAERLQVVLDGLSKGDVNRFFDRIEEGADTLRDVAGDFENLTGVASGLGLAFASMGLRAIPIIGGFAPAISPLTGILGGLLLATDEGREGLERFTDAFRGLPAAVGPQVLESLDSVASTLGAGLGDALGILGPALADVAEDLLPVLAQSLEELAPPAADLLVAFSELAAAVLPEVSEALVVVLPVVQTLSPLVSGLASAVSELAEHAQPLAPVLVGVGAGLAAMKAASVGGGLVTSVRSLGGSLQGILTGASGAAIAVGGLATAFAMWQQTMGAARAEGEAAVADLTSKFEGLDPAKVTIDSLAGSIDALNFDISKMREEHGNSDWGLLGAEAREQLDAQINGAKELQSTIRGVFTRANELAATYGYTGQQAAQLAYEEHQLGEEMDRAQQSASLLDEALGKLAGEQITSEQAAIRQAEAIDRLAQSLATNGSTLDINTQKGRANRQAIVDAANAAKAHAQALLEQTGNTGVATDKLRDHATQLKNVLSMTSLTDAEIRQYLGSLGLLPRQITTLIQETGSAESAARVADLRDRIAEVPASKQSWIEALIDQGKLAAAEAALNNLSRNRVATVTTEVRQVVVGTTDNLFNVGPFGTESLGGGPSGKKPAGMSAAGMLSAGASLQSLGVGPLDELLALLQMIEQEASSALGDVWDRITGRESRQDAAGAVRRAENALEKARDRRGVEAAETAGEKDVDEAIKTRADAKAAVADALKARDAINKAFNPQAWREANKAVNAAQGDFDKAVNQVEKAKTRADKAVAAAKTAARREIAAARQAVEDANRQLLEQSTDLATGSAKDRERFREIAKAAGLNRGEIKALVKAYRELDQAQKKLTPAERAQDKRDLQAQQIALMFAKAGAPIDDQQAQRLARQVLLGQVSMSDLRAWARGAGNDVGGNSSRSGQGGGGGGRPSKVNVDGTVELGTRTVTAIGRKVNERPIVVKIGEKELRDALRDADRRGQGR